MFNIRKTENTLSQFSPGFLCYKESILFLDQKAQSVFQLDQRMVTLETFLAILDTDSSLLLRRIITTREVGDSIILNASAGKEGSLQPVLIQGSVIERDTNGKALCFSGYCVAVRNEFSVPRIYDATGIGLWEWNGVSGKCIFCKDYHRMLGYDWPYETLPDTFQGWKELVHPDDLEAVAFQEKLAQNPDAGDKFACFVRLRRKNGEYIWTIGKGFVVQRDQLGRAVFIQGTNQDIEIVQKEYEKVLEQSLHDTLTGCYNRAFFSKYWDRIKKDNIWPISFLYLDLCGLKMVNDLLGHDFGDKMILKMVSIMNAVIQMSKYIIRMGGDEFLIILPECSLELVAECERNLRKYMKIKNAIEEIPVIFSVGFSSMKSGDESLTDMISQAERDMQKKKEWSHPADIYLMQSYIEKLTGAKVSYQDSRLRLL